MGDPLDIPINQPSTAAPDPDQAPKITAANIATAVSIETPASSSLPALANTAQPASTSIPNAEEMQKTLEQSGKLLNEIGISSQPKVDTSPLAALQPENMLQTTTGPQPIRLPSQHEKPLGDIELANSQPRSFFNLNGKALLLGGGKWLLLIIGAFLSIYTLLQTANFFFTVFPQLEQTIALAGVQDDLLPVIIAELIAATAAILLFGLVIRVVLRRKLSPIYAVLMIIVIVACLLATSQAGAMSVALAQQSLGTAAQPIRMFPDIIWKNIPWLEQQEDGTFEPVWYQ